MRCPKGKWGNDVYLGNVVKISRNWVWNLGKFVMGIHVFVYIFFFFFSWFGGFRFDGVDLLKKWSGKKIMFVGDSLSLNMWESLSCMLQASVPNAKTTFVRRDSLSSVFFQVLS